MTTVLFVGAGRHQRRAIVRARELGHRVVAVDRNPDAAGLAEADAAEVVDFVNVEGRMTAGRLAELTGLTTGAITGVIDRLEKAGFVRRERDDSDRRKVFIVPVPERMMAMGRPYELVKRAMRKQSEAYSDAELELLVRYGTDSYRSMLQATTQLLGMLDEEKSATKPRRKT